MTTKDQERLAAQGWRAFSKHFRKCPTCQQRNREWAGRQQFCSIGQQLFLSKALTDEDRERLEFQARMSRLANSRERFWKKAKAAAKVTAEWVAGIGIVIGSVWALTEILTHVHLRLDHDWWAYHAWQWYRRWWFVTAPHTIATVLALLAPKEKDEPTRAQLLFTWNSAVAGFWVSVFGIFWAAKTLGAWLGIPVFLVACIPAGLVWRRLNERFGYLSAKTTKQVGVSRS
jgi:hypothetical protein